MSPEVWTKDGLKKVKTGTDIAEWLAENLNREFVNVIVHSWNPIGAQDMLSILKDFNVVPYPFGEHLFSFLEMYIPTLRDG